MDECKAMGLNVLRPDINESGLNFKVNSKGDIRFGLAGIKGVGEGAVEAIIEEREKNGYYKDIFDFVERVSLSACNKKVIESLTIAGAFDDFPNFYREQMFALNSKNDFVIDTIVRYGNIFQTDKQQQTNSLFGDSFGVSVDIQHPEMPQCPKDTPIVRLNKEKEVIGIYLSAHPLDEYKFEIQEMSTITTSDLNYFDKWKQNYINRQDPSRSKPRTFVPGPNDIDPKDWLKDRENMSWKIGGIISKAETIISYTGASFGRYTIEDYNGSWNFDLYDEQFRMFSSFLQPNNFVMMTGVIQQRGADSTKYRYTPKAFENASYEFKLQAVDMLSSLQSKLLHKLIIKMQAEKITHEFNLSLQEILDKLQLPQEPLPPYTRQTPRATAELLFTLYDGLGHNVVTLTSQKYQVHVTPELYNFLLKKKEEGLLTFNNE